MKRDSSGISEGLALCALGKTSFSSDCYPDNWTEIESASAPQGWEKWDPCGG